jgi:glutaredoxin
MQKAYIGLALLVTLLLTGCSSGGEEKLDSFAACLTQKGATMYGTEWCSHCKNQKALFGRSFKQINFVDCDKEKDTCLIAEITGYPTWVFADKSSLSGTQTLEILARKTGCQLSL